MVSNHNFITPCERRLTMVAGPSMDEQDFENRTPHKKEKKGRGERERGTLNNGEN